MDLAGWNSIQTTGLLSNFFFWVSIAALVLLGIAEVASHRYGERRDWLANQQQNSEKQASDNEIARLHRETAALTADAEKSRAAIAGANARALEAQLALEKYKAPRLIKPDGLLRLTAALSPFAKTEFDVAVGPMGDPEPEILAATIASALTNAGWTQIAWKTADPQLTLEKPGKPTIGFAAVTNVIVDIHPEQAARLSPIARAVAAALTAEGVAAEPQQGSGGRNTNENAIHIMVGRKM